MLKYGDARKLEEHKKSIRGFKGRSEVAIAKPRINGKYVKKEVYQRWLAENGEQ